MSRSEREPSYATTEAVAGLASEVDGLRRRMEPLHQLTGQVAEISGQVAQLAEQVADLAASTGPAVVRSWLALDEDTELAARTLAELRAWLQAVFLRFPDGCNALPECWAWHPDVVEELLWLMQAWSAAYFDDGGGILRVADWHDRYRPGVTTRIQRAAGNCSLDNHTPPEQPPSLPLAGADEALADWWATGRSGPAPEPTEDQLDEVAPRRARGGVRR